MAVVVADRKNHAAIPPDYRPVVDGIPAFAWSDWAGAEARTLRLHRNLGFAFLTRRGRLKVPAGSGSLPEIEILFESSLDDPFTIQVEPPSLKGVILDAASISFARAIDHTCRESGCQWLIKIDTEGKPTLQIEPMVVPITEELENEDAYPNGEPPVDLKNPSQRDLLVSNWYLNMRPVVERLEQHTGHKFKPVAKVDAGPVEILEEQTAFMKAFLEETERIAKEMNPVDEASDR